LGPTVNSLDWEGDPDISSDGSTLFFTSDRPGGYGSWDAWQAKVIPITDFNSDGLVDTSDMCVMVNHWGENYSLCDIGPTPLGDGIVNIQDLIVLAEHMCGYRHPIAHWTLDEREGNTAYDKVGENNASVYGGALWHPAEGIFGGALEFDGIDDYASTGFVLNPANNPFSLFVWMKDGLSGQVIISQSDGIGTGETWLGLDDLSGNLMTGLVPPPVGRFITLPMKSESLITDGHWHHVGFVWDGSYRSLYVDGLEVAKDINPITLAPLKSASGGLLIGTSKKLDAGTFFYGMIDDVRIYNIALTTEEIADLAQ
jgi:hypothetical protein